MKRFKIEVTDEALDNLELIFMYIAEELKSMKNAQKQYDKIVNQIMKLDVMPERYHLI